MASIPVAFWLVPAEPDHRALSQRIAALAAEHDAPLFEPHITLHVGRLADGESLESLLSQVARTAAPLTLIAGATAHSDQLFKALYVEFDDPQLHRIHRALRERLSAPSDYTLAPHLSLLYKRLPQPQREALAQRQRLAGQPIAFDTLVAVRPAAGRSDLSEVAGWDTTLRCGL
ncbi:MAG TPA: 2'-5' RNA ligase family protein [Burkholderiaceae bacterium]|nr:2'-5' RNA ligase family protein [Burkholderiaceae bacterium]